MRIAFHPGGRARVGKYLKAALENNRSILETRGIGAPFQNEYKLQMRQVVQRWSGSNHSATDLIQTWNEEGRFKSLVFSNEFFLGSPESIFDNGELYPLAEGRVLLLSDFFKGCDLTILLTIESPRIFPERSPNFELKQKIAAASVKDIWKISWYEIIFSMLRVLPDAKFIIVISEAAAAHFEEVFRMFTGFDGADKLIGMHDMLSKVINTQGQRKLSELLTQKQRDSGNLESIEAMALLQTHGKKDSSYALEEIFGYSTPHELELVYREDIKNLEHLDRVTVVGASYLQLPFPR